MVEGDVDGGMIEIGDPTEEPSRVEPPPRVVIEYRERGVPWMLVPPLLILSAMGAVLVYHKFAPSRIRPQSASPVKPAAIGQVQSPPSNGPPERVLPKSATPTPTPAPAPAVDKPVEPAAPPPATATAAAVTMPPSVEAPPSSELPPIPEQPANPPTFPRVEGLGFDPKALEAQRKAEATGDEALAPASKEDQPAQPTDRADAPVEPEQPTEVNPDLLPPDPRLAKVRQKQRQAELRQQVEGDRTEFHAELKAICRKSRENCLDDIKDVLFPKYGTQLEPAVKERAVRLLTGRYAGADRATRIDLLRGVGFPEIQILNDIYENFEVRRIGERDGPRHDSEAMYRASLFLLNHPPRPANPPSRAVSATGTNLPALPPGPGNR